MQTTITRITIVGKFWCRSVIVRWFATWIASSASSWKFSIWESTLYSEPVRPRRGRPRRWHHCYVSDLSSARNAHARLWFALAWISSCCDDATEKVAYQLPFSSVYGTGIQPLLAERPENIVFQISSIFIFIVHWRSCNSDSTKCCCTQELTEHGNDIP